jgi:hypothetical protein
MGLTKQQKHYELFELRKVLKESIEELKIRIRDEDDWDKVYELGGMCVGYNRVIRWIDGVVGD